MLLALVLFTECYAEFLEWMVALVCLVVLRCLDLVALRLVFDV